MATSPLSQTSPFKYYRGFSTKQYADIGGQFGTYNEECILEDLKNAIFTERGTRLYMPTYGTRIPILTFEPNDAATMDIIRSDLQTVIDEDPRIKLIDMSINQVPEKYTIAAVIKILFVDFNVTKDLYIEIHSR